MRKSNQMLGSTKCFASFAIFLSFFFGSDVCVRVSTAMCRYFDEEWLYSRCGKCMSILSRRFIDAGYFSLTLLRSLFRLFLSLFFLPFFLSFFLCLALAHTRARSRARYSLKTRKKCNIHKRWTIFSCLLRCFVRSFFGSVLGGIKMAWFL